MCDNVSMVMHMQCLGGAFFIILVNRACVMNTSGLMISVAVLCKRKSYNASIANMIYLTRMHSYNSDNILYNHHTWKFGNENL